MNKSSFLSVLYIERKHYINKSSFLSLYIDRKHYMNKSSFLSVYILKENIILIKVLS